MTPIGLRARAPGTVSARVDEIDGRPAVVVELGGAGAHARSSGVASLVVGDRAEARDAVEHLLAYLPDNVDTEPPRWSTDDPPDRPTPEAGALMPPVVTGSYDVRAVMRAVVD